MCTEGVSGLFPEADRVVKVVKVVKPRAASRKSIGDHDVPTEAYQDTTRKQTNMIEIHVETSRNVKRFGKADKRQSCQPSAQQVDGL